MSTNELIENSIAALRFRKCWGCGSTDHGIDKCPTHCITSKSNLKDPNRIVKREPYKKPPFKKICAIVSTPQQEASVAMQDGKTSEIVTEGSANEDLQLTFGDMNNTTDDDPVEVDMDEALVAQVARDLASEYKICTVSAFEEINETDFDDDDFDPCIQAVHSINTCTLCSSFEHDTKMCPYIIKQDKVE